jgi:hypothetical protein
MSSGSAKPQPFFTLSASKDKCYLYLTDRTVINDKPNIKNLPIVCIQTCQWIVSFVCAKRRLTALNEPKDVAFSVDPKQQVRGVNLLANAIG